MKIGDMVEQDYSSTLKRRGIILEVVHDLMPNTSYCRVSWLPNPDIPIYGQAIYNDYTQQEKLKVISSI